ncbi:MAG TPA: hypothetical protein VGE11_00765 [Pseudonocardia sp.]
MARRLLLIVAACAVLVVVAVVLIRPWPDPNHQSAENVVRNAGVAVNVTPGPPP